MRCGVKLGCFNPYNFGSSDIPMGNLNGIQIKSTAMEIDGNLEMITIPESIGLKK
jgi:hypothetical protein